MKKIILAACNAKYIHSNLAIYNLKAYANEYGEEAVLREYTINQQKDEILRDLYKQQPDVICFSCYIWNISFVEEILEDLHKILPEVSLWTGGPEVSFQSEQFLQKNPHVTGVMVAEGEETFLELAKFYRGHGVESLEEIDGIVFRNGTEICRNKQREILDLSKVPFAYKNLEDFEHRIIYYESSRGCPFSCSYCLSSIDKKLRFRDIDLVKKELQFFIDHKVPQVKFVDRTFNCKHDHAMAIWNYIKEHDNGITNFHFEVAADLLQEEELACMKDMRQGLIQLEIGVQSTNPETIQAIHRKMDFQKVSKIVQRIQDMGNIHQHLDLIAGLPYENLESFRNSFNDVYALHPEQLQLGFLKVLKGSFMYEEAERYDCVYQNKEPYEVLSTKWLPYRDVLALKNVENMVEVYYNSGQFHSTLEMIIPQFPSPFDFYKELGDFYEEKGYAAVSHNRIRRYEILQEFVEENCSIILEKVKICMTFDLYERENLKNRPLWMENQKPYEKAIWSYRRECKVPKTAHIEVISDGRILLFDYEKRNKLTNNAEVVEIQIPDICEQ